MKRARGYKGSRGPASKRRKAWVMGPRGNPFRGPPVVAVVPGFTRSNGSYGRYGRHALDAGLRPEFKFFNTTLATSMANTLAVDTSINLIPQGDTESTRDGRQCTIKSIAFSGVLTSNVVTPSDPQICWIYCILDTQCNGAVAAITDIFDTNVPGIAFMNLSNSNRFKILKKFAVPLNSTAGDVSTQVAAVSKTIKWYKKCSIPLEFSGTTGAVTEIRSNNIFFVTAELSANVNVRGVVRVRFVG